MIRRQEMIDFLVVALLKPDRELARKQIDELVTNNNELYHTAYRGFSYRDYYVERGGTFITDLGWDPKLHPQLEYQAEGVLVRSLAIEKDFDYIKATFSLLTDQAKNWHQFRNALPDCVTQLHPGLHSLPRLCEVERYIDDPSLKFRYEMLLPRLHTYSMMSLLT